MDRAPRRRDAPDLMGLSDREDAPGRHGSPARKASGTTPIRRSAFPEGPQLAASSYSRRRASTI